MVHKVLVSCQCGCTILKISRDDWEGIVNYDLEAYLAGFHSNQRGIFGEVGKRLKGAWAMLRGKEFHLYDITMDEPTFKNLIDAMIDLQNRED